MGPVSAWLVIRALIYSMKLLSLTESSMVIVTAPNPALGTQNPSKEHILFMPLSLSNSRRHCHHFLPCKRANVFNFLWSIRHRELCHFLCVFTASQRLDPSQLR